MSMIKSGDLPPDAGANLRLHYPGKQSMPLTDEGRKAFREAARSGDLKDQLIGQVPLITGLRNGTLGHLQKGWLERSSGNLRIRIPGGEIECRVSPGRRGRSITAGDPCKLCVQNDGKWGLRGKLQPRVVPVPEEDVAELLERYLKLNGHLATVGTVTHRIQELGKRAGFEENISVSNLRTTFGVLLVEKGFDPEVIHRVMGHSDSDSGKKRTQRYFFLSDEYGFPPYYCGEQTDLTKSCENTVFFPTERCYLHRD